MIHRLGGVQEEEADSGVAADDVGHASPFHAAALAFCMIMDQLHTFEGTCAVLRFPGFSVNLFECVTDAGRARV